MRNIFYSWIKIIYPFLFVILVLLGTVWAFYGNFTMELTGNSQKSTFQKLDLLEFELSWAGSRENLTNKVAVFSLSHSDLNSFELKKSGSAQNISLIDHLKLSKRILHMNPEHIYLHWFFPTDPSPSEVSAIMRLFPEKTNISIVSSFDRAEVLKKDFPGTFEILVADFCNGKNRTVCPYNPSWNYLAIQRLAETYGQVSQQSLSQLLPNANPSYILTPLKRGLVPTYRYRDVASLSKEAIEGKVVFLGTDLLQGSAGMTTPEDIARVPSIFNSQNKPLRANGTPVHEYLGLILENILSHGWIKVVPDALAMAVTAGIPLLLLIFLFYFSIAFATTFFLGTTALIIIGNILSIKYFNLYFPDYNCLFLSVLCLTGGGFVKYAIEYSRYSAAADKEKFLLSKVDIKYNFISLISHNLNTPVAKIKVLVERILKNEPKNPEVFLDINFYLTDMQMAIRAVLTSTRLEEGHVVFESIDNERLEDDLRFDVTALFKRRNVDFTYELDVLAPFKDDRKLLVTFISSVGFLVPGNSTLFFSLTGNGDLIVLEWISNTKSPNWEGLANSNLTQSHDPILSFILNFVSKRKTNFSLNHDEDGDTLSLTFNVANL